MGLFGPTDEDEQGNTFIMVENKRNNLNIAEDREEGELYNEL